MALLGLAIGLTTSCGAQGSQPAFDEQRAWADLLAQVEFGPRVPGTEAHRRCLDWMEAQFTAAGWHVERQTFTARLALTREERSDLTNLIVTKRPGANPSFALSAHWDCRAFADFDPNPANRGQPVPGANDAASGVAVLLELARCLRDHPQAERLVFFLWDAEDQGVQRQNDTWCLGSRHFATRALPELGWNLEKGVNVDMVADDDLQLPRERASDEMAPEWTDRIWRRGQQLYPDVYLDDRRPIVDDHLPFLSRGIEYIDIIDIDYPEWHTVADAPDACSADSLAAVGDVLLPVFSEVLSAGGQ